MAPQGDSGTLRDQSLGEKVRSFGACPGRGHCHLSSNHEIVAGTVCGSQRGQALLPSTFLMSLDLLQEFYLSLLHVGSVFIHRALCSCPCLPCTPTLRGLLRPCQPSGSCGNSPCTCPTELQRSSHGLLCLNPPSASAECNPITSVTMLLKGYF